jgi:ABC-2 type transport system permease protein
MSDSFSDTLVLARRAVMRIVRAPDLLLAFTVQPIMFVLLFVYVLGGAIAGSSREYLQFALPGLLAQSVVFTTMTTAMSLNSDFSRGLIDRFRSLPMARSAVVAGRVAADTVRVGWGSVVMVLVAVPLGFRFTGGFLGGVGAFVLILAIGVTMCWPMAYMGARLKTVEAVQQVGFLTIMPLTFASSVFVNPKAMPGWLEAFVNANPVSVLVTACRGLMAGSPDAGDITIVLLVAAGLVVVFAPLTTRLYRRPA